MSGDMAGTLAQRVTIQRRMSARDDLGGQVESWSQGEEQWAALAPIADGPSAGDAPFGTIRWKATVRAGVAVAPGDRVRWRGRLFGVVAVTADPATPDRLALRLEDRG